MINFKSFMSEQRGFKDKSVASKGGRTAGNNRFNDAWRKTIEQLDAAKKSGDQKAIDAIQKKRDKLMDNKYK